MISIVIPLYNKSLVVEKTLESVLAQTYQDYELIIVNDGSTDGSDQIATQFVESNRSQFRHPVKIINQNNQGVSAARNQGIKEATGDIVAFLDADDEWLPDYLNEINYLSEKYPSCAVFGTSYYLKPSHNQLVPAPIRYIQFAEDGLLTNYFTVVSRSWGPLWTSACAVKKNALIEIGLFPVGIHLGKDVILLAKLACQFKIAYSCKYLSIYNRIPEVYSHSIQRYMPSIADDYVGNELLKLRDSFDIPDLDRFVFLWMKIRFVSFVMEGSRNQALKEFIRIVPKSLINLDCIYHLFLLCLPDKLRKTIHRHIERIKRK